MALSSSQRVLNDISSYEDSSDHKVSKQNYYIVRLELHDDTKDITEFAKKDVVAKYAMNQSVICAYVYFNTAYILFSSVDDTVDHYLHGSHQALCSHYASNAALYHGCHVTCNIIELTSRTKVLVYLQTKVFENTKKSLRKLSNITISKKETFQLTQSELIDMLEKRAAVKWQDSAPNIRYGSFYKYEIDNKGVKKFSVLSDQLNAKTIEKCSMYLFGT